MKSRNKFSKRVQVLAMSADDGRTQQHFKEEVNINQILKKYRKTGIIEHVSRSKERFGDFSQYDGLNLAENLDKMEKAKQQFDMLPAELRNQFKNSIGGFFEFIGDEKNRDQCVKWGIFNAPVEPEAGKPASAKPAEPAPMSTKKGAVKAPVIKEEPGED